MTVTKRFIPFNGTGTSTEGLLLIHTSGGQSQGYVWESSYPGGGVALPPKTISRYLLGVNDVRMYLQQTDKLWTGMLWCGDRPLSADWTPFQNLSDVWVNFYGNNTVNLSLDAQRAQVVTNLSICRPNWGKRERLNDLHYKKTTGGVKQILPFNGGPQKITCLMVYPEHPYSDQPTFFWEQAIESGPSGAYGPARQLRLRSSFDPPNHDYVKFTIFVGLGDTPETSLLYQAPNLELDLAGGEGNTIYLNFYPSNMTANISLDGKNVHVWTKLVSA